MRTGQFSFLLFWFWVVLDLNTKITGTLQRYLTIELVIEDSKGYPLRRVLNQRLRHTCNNNAIERARRVHQPVGNTSVKQVHMAAFYKRQSFFLCVFQPSVLMHDATCIWKRTLIEIFSTHGIPC